MDSELQTRTSDKHNMPTILVTGTLPHTAKTQLEQMGFALNVHGPNDLIDEAAFINAIKDAQIYISGGNEITTARVLEAASSLELIVFLGVDCSTYIDVDAASEYGIKVCNTPGANATSVAEFTVGLMLDAQRRISLAASTFGANSASYPTCHMLHGKILGLIGFGNIARKVAQMCSGLGMTIRYWTRSGTKSDADKLGAQFIGLDELLKTSDVVSLHVPGTAGVMLDEGSFGQLMPGVTLVNTSRPNLCDPCALPEALKRDPCMYAAFDGFYEQPSPECEAAVKELVKLIPTRLIITPHVAGRTFEADDATYEMALGSISDLAAGAALRNAVN